MEIRYPYDNFLTNFNISAGNGFGLQTNYGFHEGIDINGNGGGNSDLGAEGRAISDATIVEIANDGANGFGLHMLYEIDTPFGKRWVHSAHHSAHTVKVGDRVPMGQVIYKMGTSGSSTAVHDHFAIMKQRLALRTIAKRSIDLNLFENPIEFIERCMVVIQKANEQISIVDRLQKIIQERDREIEDIKKQKEGINTDLVAKSRQVLDLQEELRKEAEDDLKIAEEALTAQKALDPYKNTIRQFYDVLALSYDTSTEDAVATLKTLKDSKVKYLKTPKGFWNKVIFLFT